jgi:hypothetical protein
MQRSKISNRIRLLSTCATLGKKVDGKVYIAADWRLYIKKK